MGRGPGRRPGFGLRADASQQHAGEEEVGDDGDPACAESKQPVEPLVDRGPGERDEGGLHLLEVVAPEEMAPVGQQSCSLGEVGVGVGIARAAPDEEDGAGLGVAGVPEQSCRLSHALFDQSEDHWVNAEVACVGESHFWMACPAA